MDESNGDNQMASKTGKEKRGHGMCRNGVM